MNIFDKNYLDRLSVISFDDNNKKALFDDDKNRYVNFDKKVLKEIYKITQKGYCDTLSAVDTIIQDNDTLYLIEFKNQTKENIKKYEIYSKAMESLAILQKYFFCDKKYKFVLIVLFNGYKDNKKNKRLGTSYSLQNIPKYFQLSRYHKIIFDEIYTLDKNIFLQFKTHFNFAKEWK